MLIHLFTIVLHEMIGITYATSYTIGLYWTIGLVIVTPEVIFRVQKKRPAALI